MVGRAQMERRLKAAPWLVHSEMQAIFALLDGEAQRTRAVGGIVRDTLLGIARGANDIDLATEIGPREVMARAQKHGIAAYPTGIEHGTVTLRLNGLVCEVTTLREDIETDGRHAVVKFGTDWRRDAERRDFTINALYADMSGTLFDPLNGGSDLVEPKIRFIGDPDQRIAEDRLRVYRFFRFSASHGGEKFDAAGLEAAKRAAGSLGALSAERVGSEMRRLLGLPRVARTVRTMHEAGIVDFDDATLDRLADYGIKARRPHFLARLALIMVAVEPEKLQGLWRLSNDETERAGTILAAARLLEDFRVHEVAYRYPEALADSVDVATVLAGWSEAGKSAVLDQLREIGVNKFPLGGNDLIGLGFEPGPGLGVELRRLERLWIESAFALDRAALLELVAR
jgi:poly(A) polymerase